MYRQVFLVSSHRSLDGLLDRLVLRSLDDGGVPRTEAPVSILSRRERLLPPGRSAIVASFSFFATRTTFAELFLLCHDHRPTTRVAVFLGNTIPFLTIFLRIFRALGSTRDHYPVRGYIRTLFLPVRRTLRTTLLLLLRYTVTLMHCQICHNLLRWSTKSDGSVGD